MDAVLDVNGVETHVFVTHFGNTEDYIDREQQTKQFAENVKTTKGPIIVLGYFVARLGDYNYKAIINSGLNDTSLSSNRYCHYIFYRDIAFSEFIRYDPGEISDTELQAANFYSDGRAPSEDLIVKNEFYTGVVTYKPLQVEENQTHEKPPQMVEMINKMRDNLMKMATPQANQEDTEVPPNEEKNSI